MQKNTDFSERIIQVIDFIGITKNEFAKKLGYERSQSIYDIVNGKSKPSFDFFEKLLNSEYSEFINIEYIISGKGNLEKTKSKEKVIKENDNLNDNLFDNKPKVKKMLSNEPEEEKVYPLYSEQEYRAVMRKIKFAEGVSLADEGAPFYPLPVSAGNAMQLLEEEEKPTGFLSIPGVYCKAYFPVIGFSFEPIIRAGDVIGIDFINRWEMLDPDCIYFIITHDQRMIKRLSDDPDNPDRLICISPNHKEFPIYKSEIKAIHKVIFYGRLV